MERGQQMLSYNHIIGHYIFAHIGSHSSLFVNLET